MDASPRKMKPIWYFVGLILAIMGALVLAAGLLDLVRGVQAKTAMARLQPRLWWGGIMVVAGSIFVWFQRHATSD